jgi:copper(I)-binding protein
LTRRPVSVALLTCAIAIPALAGCEAGLNAPTLAFHPVANGATTTGAGITINNAFLLGPAVGQTLPKGGRAGLFLSIYAANGDTLQSISAPGYASSVTVDGGPVSVSANNTVNLTGPAPRVVLTGLSAPVRGGQTITLVLDFATAGAMELQVPVEPHAFQYATFAPPPVPTPSPSPSATGTHHASASPSASRGAASTGATASPSASPSATP